MADIEAVSEFKSFVILSSAKDLITFEQLL